MTITDPSSAEPAPAARYCRPSTVAPQDPPASLRRQLRVVQEKLPPGWFIAPYFRDVESGGLDPDERGHGEIRRPRHLPARKGTRP